MNYKALVDATIYESGVDSIAIADSTNFTSPDDPMYGRFKNWVTRAWRDIQIDSSEWHFRSETAIVDIAPGIEIYNIPFSIEDYYGSIGVLAVANAYTEEYNLEFTRYGNVKIFTETDTDSGITGKMSLEFIGTIPSDFVPASGSQYVVFPKFINFAVNRGTAPDALWYVAATPNVPASPLQISNDLGGSTNPDHSVFDVTLSNPLGTMSRLIVADYADDGISEANVPASIQDATHLKAYGVSTASTWNPDALYNLVFPPDTKAGGTPTTQSYTFQPIGLATVTKLYLAKYGGFYPISYYISDVSYDKPESIILENVGSTDEGLPVGVVFGWKGYNLEMEYSEIPNSGEVAQIDRASFWLTDKENDGISSPLKLEYIEWSDISIEHDMLSHQPGTPQYVTQDNEGYWRFYPAPNKTYNLTYEYTKSPQILAAESDVPVGLASQYHDIIMYKALQYFGEYDSNPSIAARAKKRYRDMLFALQSYYKEQFHFRPAQLY